MRRCLLVVALTGVAFADRTPGEGRAGKSDPTAVDLAPRKSTPMGLPEVLQVAIRQNPALTRAVVDVDIARADVTAARGVDDFTLQLGGSFAHVPRQSTPPGVASGYIDRDLFVVDIGLVKQLFTGATVAATAHGQRAKDVYVPTAGGEQRANSTYGVAQLEVAQPLLRGRGEAVARAGVRRANVARDVASLQQAAIALDVTRDVIIAYWRVAYARQVVEIRSEAVRLAIEQLAITQRAVRTGSTSPTDGLAAEHAIAVRQEALLLAKVELSQLSLELRRLAGLAIGRDEIDLQPTTPLAKTRVFDVEETIARALERNTTLALIAAKAKGAAIDVEVTDNALWPRLDVYGTAGMFGNATTSSDSISQITSAEAPGYSVGIRYEQALGNRAAEGAHARAKAQRRRVTIDLAEAKREITVSVAHTLDLLAAAQKRIEVSDRAISLAAKNLEIEQARFGNQKATNFDVLLRQDELQQARVARALASSNALAAEATLDALTGDLLDKNGVRVSP